MILEPLSRARLLAHPRCMAPRELPLGPRILFPLLATGVLGAQCSDAGACLAGRPAASGHRMALLVQGGTSGAPDELDFRALRLDGVLQLRHGTRLSLSLPFVRIEGPRGRVAGLGDALLLAEQSLREAGSWRFAAQVGARLDTGDDAGDPALPQAYQTGLGPADFIAGLKAGHGPWNGGLVWQKAGGRSRNPLTRLSRGDDLLAWFSRDHSWRRTDFTFKLLALQRLGRSSVLDAGVGPERFVDEPESDRLQVNLGLEVFRPWRGGLGWTGRVEVPLLKRPSNVDGLKRQWSAALGLAWAF